MADDRAAAERITWIDAARGVSVLAVVLMHATLSAYLGHMSAGSSTAFWSWFIDAMTPFRMPALAMLSGLLLARRIRAGWSDRTVRVSVASSYWLYAVWLLAFALFAGLVGSYVWTGPVGMGEGVAWDAFVAQLVLPRTLLWYVFALAVWTALLTTLRRVDPALVLILLAIASACSHYLPVVDNNDQYRNVIRYALFFAIGVYGSTWLRERIGRRDAPLLLGTLATYAVSGWTISFTGNANVEYVLTPLHDASAAVVLLIAVSAICRVGWLGRGMAWVGRRTLPIYVLHGLLLEAIGFLPQWHLVVDRALVRPLAPLLIALVIAAVAISFYELVMRTPARVLFELPRPLRRALLGSAPSGR
jgi:uncharacterized membrane protein YcfT